MKRIPKTGLAMGVAAIAWHGCPLAEERKFDARSEHPARYEQIDYGKLTYEVAGSTSSMTSTSSTIVYRGFPPTVILNPRFGDSASWMLSASLKPGDVVHDVLRQPRFAHLSSILDARSSS